MQNAWLDEAGIKIAGRNINNLRYADDTTLMAESEEELKSLLMKVKEESEKVGLNSTFKVRRGGGEEIPLVQGKEQRLRFAGAAVKRYPTPKVRETQVRR